MQAALAFVDTETTGLDPERHEIWEVAVVTWPEGTEHVWLLPVGRLAFADAYALQVGGFHYRHPQGNSFAGMNGTILARDRSYLAKELAQITHGRHLAGMNPAFDADRLGRLVRSENVVPSWDYHLVDLEAVVAGSLGLPPPWHSTELSRKVGVEPDDFERHSALGDCRWARAVYEAWLSRA
jgi:DNA polymerase III epsilon subunit-like protein